VIENPKKQLYLGGTFQQGELQEMTEKELKKELKDHDAALAKQMDGDKPGLVASLLGKPRDLKLKERALASFPMRQDIPKDAARPHLDTRPNNIFVRKRVDGKYGVSHCWPIKFNDTFRREFDVCSEVNPDQSRFSPRAAAEYLDCMSRLFSPPVEQGTSIFALLGCRGRNSAQSLKGRLYYASKSTFNDRTAVVGTVEKIVEYFRERPMLQKDMGIVKMFPDGFVTEIFIKGKSSGKTKQFHMARDGTDQVAYVKVGYETMTSVKPLDLFNYDCTFGRELELDRDTRRPARRDDMAPGDRSSDAVLKRHAKDPLQAEREA